MGSTTRRLTEKVREHHPAWLNSGVVKVIPGAVCSHLTESNHIVIVTKTFRPVYEVPDRHSVSFKYRVFSVLEAVNIG